MKRAFVADASVAIGWIHPGQATKEAVGMLVAMAEGSSVEVPAIWPLEVANALIVLVRRRKLTDEERVAGLGWMHALPVKVDHDMTALAFTTLSELATTHALSVYDAAYLELARRRKLPLACADGPLKAAARRIGVSLWT